MVEGTEEDCLLECITDVDGGTELIKEVNEVCVVLDVEGDELYCLVEYTNDVDGSLEVVVEVLVV